MTIGAYPQWSNRALLKELNIDLLKILGIEENASTEECKFLPYDLVCKETMSGIDNCVTALLSKLGYKAALPPDTQADAAKIYAQYKTILWQNSFGALYPEQAQEWDYEKNDGLSPFMFFPHSKFKAWWICHNGHSYQARVSTRTQYGCKQCAIEASRIAPLEESLSVLFPETACFWDAERNAPQTPETTYGQSAQTVWWKDRHGRRWQNKVCLEVQRTNQHVPLSLGRCTGLIQGENSLVQTHPQVAALWDYDKNGGLLPDDVIANSRREVWWRDPEDDHSWKALVWYVVKRPFCPCKGQRCQKLVSGFNDLATKYPDMARIWSDRNSMSPDEIKHNSKEIV